MPKTLVTIGYHYGEIEWGRQVREAYLHQNPNGARDITFHEIQSSKVETGDICPDSIAEVVRVFEEGEFELWIDIHCGYTEERRGKIALSYSGYQDPILDLVKAIDGVNVNDTRKNGDRHTPFQQSALVDPFFLKEDLQTKSPVYMEALEKTLTFMDNIYDIHV